LRYWRRSLCRSRREHSKARPWHRRRRCRARWPLRSLCRRRRSVLAGPQAFVPGPAYSLWKPVPRCHYSPPAGLRVMGSGTRSAARPIELSARVRWGY
jgi:hypothetical protein